MSLMEKLAQIANTKTAGHDPEYDAGIDKIASHVLEGMSAYYDEQQNLEKQAEEAFPKLAAEEIAEIREYIAEGRGMQRGEEFGKIAGYQQGTQDMLSLVYTKIAAQNEEFANALVAEIYKEAGVTEEDLAQEQEMESVKQDITERAAQKLLESHPDPEKITPEEAEQIAAIAQQAGELGLQQLLEGEGSPEGAEAAPEKTPEKEPEAKA